MRRGIREKGRPSASRDSSRPADGQNVGGTPVAISAPVPPNNLLVSGRVLLFLPSLVAAIGLNEALVLQQVRYHLVHAGRDSPVV